MRRCGRCRCDDGETAGGINGLFPTPPDDDCWCDCHLARRLFEAPIGGMQAVLDEHARRSK